MATREERLVAASKAWSQADARLHAMGRSDRERFVATCCQAIAAAAMWMDRDPVEFAESLAAGEIADLYRQAENGIGLPFSVPEPKELVDERLRAAAAWAERERERIEKETRRITKQLTDLSAALIERESWRTYWRSEWPRVKAEWDEWLRVRSELRPR